MKTLIRELNLPNGLTVSIYNGTHRYFGDYHHVRMFIECKISDSEHSFPNGDVDRREKTVADGTLVYRRTDERMGVPTADVESVMEQLMANFVNHSLPYFSSAQFPAKALRAESGKTRRTRAHMPDH